MHELLQFVEDRWRRHEPLKSKRAITTEHIFRDAELIECVSGDENEGRDARAGLQADHLEEITLELQRSEQLVSGCGVQMRGPSSRRVKIVTWHTSRRHQRKVHVGRGAPLRTARSASRVQR